jgi:hypothetical protein
MDVMSSAPELNQPAPMQDTSGPDRTLIAGPAPVHKTLPRTRIRAIDCGGDDEESRTRPDGTYTNGVHRDQ